MTQIKSGLRILWWPTGVQIFYLWNVAFQLNGKIGTLKNEWSSDPEQMEYIYFNDKVFL